MNANLLNQWAKVEIVQVEIFLWFKIMKTIRIAINIGMEYEMSNFRDIYVSTIHDITLIST